MVGGHRLVQTSFVWLAIVPAAWTRQAGIRQVIRPGLTADKSYRPV